MVSSTCQVAKGLAADKFRLVAIDSTGAFATPSDEGGGGGEGEAKDAKAKAKAAKAAAKGKATGTAVVEFERASTPPVDEGTGFGGWQTLSVRGVTRGSASDYDCSSVLVDYWAPVLEVALSFASTILRA